MKNKRRDHSAAFKTKVALAAIKGEKERAFLSTPKDRAKLMNNNHPKYFNDDGTEINPDLIPKPDLCITCKKDGLPGEEEVLCDLTRADQQGEDEFVCEAYEEKE